MLGTPTAKSLRSFYFKCGVSWLVSDALQYVGVDMHACAFVCIYFEKLRDWIQEKLYLKWEGIGLTITIIQTPFSFPQLGLNIGTFV